MNLLLSVLLGFLVLTGTRLPPHPQGIQEKAVRRTGNHMPGKQIPPSSQPSVRQIHVYPPTLLSQVTANGSFYTQIQTKLVAKVVSGRGGTFRLALPPGRSTLLAKETDGLFASRLGGENNIFAVEVKAGRLTQEEFIMDYNASY